MSSREPSGPATARARYECPSNDTAHPERLLSAGTVLPEAECRVVDVGTGKDVAPGEPGELWFRTPQLMKGYLGKPEETDKVITGDGWFRTGDIGRVDDDGFVWVEGRLSDMINRGGLKIFPGEVEEVLRLEPAIADVAVVGVPDDRVGEVPVAFVVVRSKTELRDTSLEELCRRHLAPYKVPVRFERVDALPRNEVGKVLTRSLIAGPEPSS